MTKLSKLADRMHYNLQPGIHTSGFCHNEGCKTSARGSGICNDCTEIEIAELLDDESVADVIHSAIRNIYAAKYAAEDLITEHEDKSND